MSDKIRPYFVVLTVQGYVDALNEDDAKRVLAATIGVSYNDDTDVQMSITDTGQDVWTDAIDADAVPAFE